MKINSYKPCQNFKGYDAAVIKNIYVQDNIYNIFQDEIRNFCKKENIDTYAINHRGIWLQDYQTILNNDDKKFILASQTKSPKEAIRDFNDLGFNIKKSPCYIPGGNCFIGLYPNGEKWMMVGSDDLYSRSKKAIMDRYKIKKENILKIPQPNFHLDMALRPIGYPYILVNDFELSKKYIDDLYENNADYKTLRENFYNNKRITEYNYSAITNNKLIETLLSYGFEPIRIAGVFDGSSNFINAIVNKHADNTISYITNSTKSKNPYYSALEEIFEKELKSKVQNIKDVYFIKGLDSTCKSQYKNQMMYFLSHLEGGIHCMCMEEPDFEVWG